MSTISQTRLFKATRRFIVAEITLIVVIVVLFGWSSYVLYKLFASDTESLFGFSIKSADSPAKPEATFSNRTGAPPDGRDLASVKAQLEPVYQERPVVEPVQALERAHIQEQLAGYKEQILKELLARQQTLLGADGGNRLMSSLLGLGKDEDEGRRAEQPNIKELQQWSGGFKLPASLDNLFDNGKRVQPERVPAASAVAPLSTTRVGPKPNSLVYLEGAPSLMQLAPAAEQSDASTVTTTSAPPEVFGSQAADSQADGQDSNQLGDEQLDELPSTTESSQLAADAETTTAEPPAREDESDAQQTTTLSPQVEPVEPSQSSPEDEADAGTDRSDPGEHADDEKLTNTVKTIDEEVDRMTQPSQGSVSQHDKTPSADLRATVHFDDTSSPDPSEAPPVSRATRSKAALPRIASPDADEHKNRRHDHQDLLAGRPGLDLLAADNLYKSPSPSALDSGDDGSSRSQINSRHFRNRPRPVVQALNQTGPDQERGLKSRKRVKHIVARLKRSALGYSSPAFSSQAYGPASGKIRSMAGRRSDEEDDDYNDDNPAVRDDEEHLEAESEKDSMRSKFASGLVRPTLERKQSVTHEPSFDELLAHKQLLDALQQSRLPAPVSTNASAVAKPAGSGDDHQSADSLYNVDHSLMLYPSEKKEHGHKSKSHKSAKAKKKKSKKKMSAAVKKGGHKSKKHKKEEKKYHKEKKFKGAKKGKKMKKGKGGKGGKKGKKLFKDKGYKKKGFKNTYVKNEFGSKKSYFDEFRDKDFKKKWKNFDDKYNYAQMKKWQAKDIKKAKKMKDHGAKYKKYDKGKWKKMKHAEMSSGSKKKMSKHHKSF